MTLSEMIETMTDLGYSVAAFGPHSAYLVKGEKSLAVYTSVDNRYTFVATMHRGALPTIWSNVSNLSESVIRFMED